MLHLGLPTKTLFVWKLFKIDIWFGRRRPRRRCSRLVSWLPSMEKLDTIWRFFTLCCKNGADFGLFLCLWSNKLLYERKQVRNFRIVLTSHNFTNLYQKVFHAFELLATGFVRGRFGCFLQWRFKTDKTITSGTNWWMER